MTINPSPLKPILHIFRPEISAPESKTIFSASAWSLPSWPAINAKEMLHLTCRAISKLTDDCLLHDYHLCFTISYTFIMRTHGATVLISRYDPNDFEVHSANIIFMWDQIPTAWISSCEYHPQNESPARKSLPWLPMSQES